MEQKNKSTSDSFLLKFYQNFPVGRLHVCLGSAGNLGVLDRHSNFTITPSPFLTLSLDIYASNRTKCLHYLPLTQGFFLLISFPFLHH